MKKLFLQLFAITVIFSSCSSSDSDSGDNEDPQNPTAEIIGTWNGVDVEYSGTTTFTILGENVVSTFIGEAYDVDFTLIFTENPNNVVADGSYSLNLTVTTLGEVQTETVENLELLDTGTWIISGSTLSITAEGETTEATIMELTETSLILRIIEEENYVENGLEISAEIEALVTLSRN